MKFDTQSDCGALKREIMRGKVRCECNPVCCGQLKGQTACQELLSCYIHFMVKLLFGFEVLVETSINTLRTTPNDGSTITAQVLSCFHFALGTLQSSLKAPCVDQSEIRLTHDHRYHIFPEF